MTSKSLELPQGEPLLTHFHAGSVDEAQVDAVIQNLKNKNSSGNDNISNTILKQNKQILVPILIQLFNKSLKKNVFPCCLKKAIVLPIYKGGEKYEKNNYRPISLISSVPKAL